MQWEAYTPTCLKTMKQLLHEEEAAEVRAGPEGI